MNKHRTRETMWNRLLSGVLCLALVIGLLPTAGLIRPAAAASWADPYGEQLVEWGVMTPSMASDLGAVITRAEFVAMCNRAFGYKKLGDMPFTDVNVKDWYYEDINIAYNAGYFSGTSATTASPNGTLTREMAAVAVARNLVLQETVGESLGFTDSRELSDWSRGLIGTAVAQGVITGFSDGSFRPRTNITRGEVAALLVRLIGTPINKEGSYELGDVYGNVVISSSNVTLRDTTIVGNLYVTGGVDLGNVLLENVDVLGQIVICGGGESHTAQSSVVLLNVKADEMLVDSIIDQFVTISAYGVTDIPVTNVRTNAYLEDACEAGHGLHLIELDGEAGTMLQLAGDIKEVFDKTPFSDLELVKGTAQKITIDEYAKGSQVKLSEGTLVYEMNLDVATLVTGKGDIKNLNIWAAGCDVEMLPENITIRPGITAIVGGRVIGDLEAGELSSEPRLLAGYPTVVNIAPTEAEGLFTGNKPGTIYWAISELAEGSVDPDDLIHNPVYGGNIFEKQAGSISANGKTEYGRQITKLVPDGSYYISAVLVDDRGSVSPLKVAAFTTPDNTVPAFVKGYPYMSRVTCETAQVAAMPNKNCQLYYALLPAGADAPTPQQFKSGSIGGNYGYGSVSVVKNVPVYITVNRARLQEKTTYWLYLWLTDYNGVQSMATPVRLEFTTPDETPPVVTKIEQTNFTLPDAIEFTFAISEAPSTLYWAVVKESDDTWIALDEDMNSPTTQLKVVNGAKTSSAVFVSGSKAADGANVDTLVEAKDFANKLKYETCKTHNFKLWYVAKDADGNFSEVKYIIIHTRDTEPPIVVLDDKDTVDGKYPADSNLRLIFSEQVKGSAKLDVETFVDLYNEVLKNQDVGGNALDAAKDALAKELAAHITLWYKPKSVMEGEDVPLSEAVGRPTIGGSGTYKYGWVNWHEATVTLQPDGRVFLTLPAGEAVALGSGMDYYFRFEKIYDDSYDHNLLAVTDEKGQIIDGGGTDDVCLLPFSTIYATVWLELNRTDGSPTIQDGVVLDRIVNVSPRNTGNMSDECWDMIIWNRTASTPVGFTLYRRVNDGNGWGDWEQVTNEITILGGNLPAASVNANKTDAYKENPGQYETVKDGLVQGYNYQYGFHFTLVGSSRDRDSWVGVIQMEVSLVAGAKGSVQDLDTVNVDGSYKSLVHPTEGSAPLSEIGLTTTTREPILEFTKEFSDKKPPSFGSTSPNFVEIKSGSFIMQVTLDRAGEVYYVVAPADGSIDITYQKIGANSRLETVTIDETNDGRDGNFDFDGPELSYIPDGGTDRDDHALNILFMNGGNKDPDKTNDKEYSSPSAGEVFTHAFDNPNGDLKMGVVSYKNRRVDESITGLSPDTWYYVYIVLQSESNQGVGGTLDRVVQVYRVKTKEAQPPTITGSRSGTKVSMEVYEGGTNNTTLHDNPELYYATVRKDDLAKWMNYKYVWNDELKAVEGEPEMAEDDSTGSLTIFEAMMRRASNGKTVFDMYANEYLRQEVMYYITEATSENAKDDSIRTHPAIYENKSAPDCADDLSQDGEYVVLICAKHREKGKADATAYGFFAIQGLYKPDPEPPEFTSLNGDTGRLVEIEFDGVYRPSDLNTNLKKFASDWRGYDGLNNFVFSGTLTLTFSKDIYVYDKGVLKQVVNKNNAPANATEDDKKSGKYVNTATEISILSVIGSNQFTIAQDDEGEGGGTTFYLTFTQKGSLSITMQNLYNSGGVVKSDKKLTIRLDKSVTQADYNALDGIVSTEAAYKLHRPSFRVSWQ